MAKRKVFSDFDPAPSGPTVSETLRDTRVAHGYDLRDVAAMLRIRYPYLLAIEEGRYGDLPGSAYAVGFLRSYAECLGLDPDTVVARYKEEAAGTVRRQELYLPTPAAEGRASGGTLLLGTLVLAGIVYGGWYYLSTTDRSVADLVPTLPDRLVSLLDGVPSRPDHPPAADATAPAAAPATPPTAPSAVTPAAPPTGAPAPAPAPTPSVPMPVAPPSVASATPPAPAAAGPAPGAAKPAVTASGSAPPPVAPAKPPTVAALAPAPAGVINVPAPPAEDDEDSTPQEPTSLATAAAPPAAPAAPAAETVPANGKVYGTLNTNAKLVLKATQESWLQVRDGSEIVFTRVLKPGDTFRVPDKPNVKIRTGNAGGLVVMADGTESPPLGSVGQVLRDVTIDQRGLVRR